MILTDFPPRFFTLANSVLDTAKRSATVENPAFWRALKILVGRSSSSTEMAVPEDDFVPRGAEEEGKETAGLTILEKYGLQHSKH